MRSLPERLIPPNVCCNLGLNDIHFRKGVSWPQKKAEVY